MLKRKTLIADVVSGDLSESINNFYENGLIDTVKEYGGLPK
jgi:hypothetical protein